jgi:hypothetical protein
MGLQLIFITGFLSMICYHYLLPPNFRNVPVSPMYNACTDNNVKWVNLIPVLITPPQTCYSLYSEVLFVKKREARPSIRLFVSWNPKRRTPLPVVIFTSRFDPRIFWMRISLYRLRADIKVSFLFNLINHHQISTTFYCSRNISRVCIAHDRVTVILRE